MAIRIITDSASDLELSDAKDWQVQVVPMSIQFGDRSYLDGLDLSKTEFYQKLLQGDESPTTAQPAPADFLQLFESARDAGDQVVVILLSSVLSGTFQSAVIAREMCGYADIHLIDSRSASTGIQLLVWEACRMRNAGASAQEISQRLETLKDRIRIFAAIDTLEYLRRGGRLSDFQAGLGTVAKIKPLITVRDGAVSIIRKSFGLSAAVKQLGALLEEHPADLDFPFFLLYSDDIARSDLLLPKLESLGYYAEGLRRASLGPTIGTHIGPGALGIVYLEQE